MKTSLLILFFSISFFAKAQYVGIAIKTPSERLQVDSGNIKIGNGVWTPGGGGRFLKFGDGDFVHLGEQGDDSLEIKARNVSFIGSYGPGTKLDVAGQIKIADGTQGAGKVLTSNADGLASWQSPAATSASFKVTKNAQILGSGASYYLSWPTKVWDDGGNFPSDAFITPSAGLYHIDVTLGWNLTNVSSRYNLIAELVVGGIEINRKQAFVEPGTAGFMTISISADVKATAGQTISVYAFQNSGINQTISASYTQFSGHKIY